MDNPHPKGSRDATCWETGYNAGRWTPQAVCPYVQPWAASLWRAGRDAAIEAKKARRGMSEFHRHLDALQQARHVSIINQIISKPLRYQCHKEEPMPDVPSRDELKKECPELFYDAQFTDVLRELRRATNKFGPFVSGHEGIAILREEYLELEREVFWGKDSSKVRAEAVQVAAMAIRFIVDVCDRSPR